LNNESENVGNTKQDEKISIKYDLKCIVLATCQTLLVVIKEETHVKLLKKAKNKKNFFQSIPSVKKKLENESVFYIKNESTLGDLQIVFLIFGPFSLVYNYKKKLFNLVQARI
jgi:hypothetical protein